MKRSVLLELLLIIILVTFTFLALTGRLNFGGILSVPPFLLFVFYIFQNYANIIIYKIIKNLICLKELKAYLQLYQFLYFL
jgi:hypothetical protein